ncbi:unnamed protein product [Alopecurus aequalis]
MGTGVGACRDPRSRDLAAPMARRAAGAYRDHRRRRAHRSNSTPGVHCYEHWNSELKSSSSSSDDNEHRSRYKVLDDALFGFFRKKVKKCISEEVDRSVYTMYSVKYFVGVIKKLTPHQRDVIQKFGFGCLLLLDMHYIPSDFIRWVAGCVDPVCSHITIHSQNIDFSKFTVHTILGVPVGGLEFSGSIAEGEEFILSHFHLSEMPHITFFGNKLCEHADLSEDDVFICFMAVAIHCFLYPSFKEHPDGKFLSALRQPATVKSYDISKLVYEHCISGVSEFMHGRILIGRRPRVPVCNYVFAVRYLDCLDFRVQNVADSVPRVSIWKGNMINMFSKLDQKRRYIYGMKLLKANLATCRIQHVTRSPVVKHKKSQSPLFENVTSEFRDNVFAKFGKTVHPDVIDGIMNIAAIFAPTKSEMNKPKMDNLVINMLDFLCKSSFTKHPALTKNDLAEVRNPMKATLPAPSSNQTPAIFPNPATPDCFITKVVEPISNMTAPVMNPLKKVKPRRC